VALQGDSGKPRPAVVIQADWFDALSTVVVLPLTSTLRDAAVTRIDVAPTDENGLKVPSQIAIDRPQTVRRPKLGPTIGRLNNDVMLAVHRALAVFLGLA
jgi:mRNA interferase MazF